jgi:puromycin-sensitive aminopeptidase
MAEAEKEDQSGARLERTAIPTRYDLRIQPDLEQARFDGEVTIHMELTKPIGSITLNAAELDIHEAKLPDGTQGRVTLQEELERCTVSFDQEISPGETALSLSFSGTLNDKLRGFYRSTYPSQEDPNVRRTLASTQFEATDARRAFPCFDEPDFKAVFSVTIDAPADLSAVSNAKLVSKQELDTGSQGPSAPRLVRYRFADTIKMSSYLVAFVVGELERTQPREVRGVELSVVHVPGKGHLTEYALEVGAHALEFFQDFFEIPYPGDKLDLVAVPDFAFGAMENLGCVTFRESLLLVDPRKASRQELEHIADVVSHEIAHMWFGDLVTMKWWNGIWLNEAFATYMEIACVDHFRPQWERWVSFAQEREASMGVDGLHTTRPIEYPVKRPEDAQGMFDILTYQKGGSVLRMLEQFLGMERFRDGIRRYLKDHAYGNAETTDLWDAIEAELNHQGVTDIPVRAIMDSFIFQGGYPLLTVSPEKADNQPGSLASSSKPGQASLHLSQEPFLYLDSSAPGSETASHPPAMVSAGQKPGDLSMASWVVPVRLRSLDGSREDKDSPLPVVLDTKQKDLEFPASPASALVANAGGSGFYRVVYDPPLYDALVQRLSDLKPLERYCLVADSWATCLAGKSSLRDFLHLCLSLGDEVDPNIWAIASGACSMLHRVATIESGSPAGPANGPSVLGVAELVRALFDPVLQRTGYDKQPGEPEHFARLRSLAVAILGTIGQEDAVRSEATRRHQAHAAGDSVDPDLLDAILLVVAQANQVRDYEDFLSRFRRPETPQEELRYLYALTGFTSPALVSRTLDLVSNEVRTQNAPYVLARMLASDDPLVIEKTWEFIETSFETLVQRFPENTLPRMLEPIRLAISPEGLATRIQGFLAEHQLASGQRTVDQALERLQVNLAFASRVQQSLATEIRQALVKNRPSNP